MAGTVTWRRRRRRREGVVDGGVPLGFIPLSFCAPPMREGSFASKPSNPSLSGVGFEDLRAEIEHHYEHANRTLFCLKK